MDDNETIQGIKSDLKNLVETGKKYYQAQKAITDNYLNITVFDEELKKDPEFLELIDEMDELILKINDLNG